MYSLGLVNNHCEIFSENPQVKSQLFTLQMWCAASGGVDRETLPFTLVCLHGVSRSGAALHCASTWACSMHRQPVWAVTLLWGSDGVSASPVLPVRMCRRYWLSVLPGNSHFSICTLCLFAECPICSSKYTWNSWYTQRLHCIKRTLIHNL